MGDPDYPVAAAERGRRVLTADGSQFHVGDHDFTTFSVIPSVILHKYSFFVFYFYSELLYLCKVVMWKWCLIMLLRYHPNLVPVLFWF